MGLRYVVQAYRHEGRRLTPKDPVKAVSEEDAREKARIAAFKAAGVIAYEVEVGDEPDAEISGDARVFFTTGDVPKHAA